MKKVILCLVIIVLVVIIGVGGWLLWNSSQNNINTETNNNLPISLDRNESSNNKEEDTNSTSKKLSYDDLRVDNLTYGMTERQVIEIMGEPDEKREETAPNIYGYSIDYKYGDLLLTFYYNHNNNLILCCGQTNSSEYTFSNELKVGDSKEKVLSSFYRESIDENNLRDIVSEYDNLPFGKYLYGNVPNAGDSINQSEKIEYAFINYHGYDKTNPDSSYMIEYKYAESPYLGDDPGSLVFYMNSEDKVTSIRWDNYNNVKEQG